MNHRVPYQRVLFAKGVGYDTLENILGAPTETELEELNGARRKFNFEIPGAGAMFVLNDILDESRVSCGSGTDSKMIIERVTSNKDLARNVYVCEVFAYLDLSPYLAKRGIHFEMEELPTRVLARRRNPFETDSH